MIGLATKKGERVMRKHIALALGALLLGAAAPSAHAAGLPPMPELTSGGSDSAPIVEARWGHGHHYGWRHHGWRHYGWRHYGWRHHRHCIYVRQ